MEKTGLEVPDYSKELLGIAEGIRRYISYGGGSDGVTVSMTKSIAEALADFIEERCHQEPVKPKRDNTGILCGQCGQWIGTNDRFCSNCGKGVKWDD